MTFPRLVYRSANSHRLARDKAEFEQLRADGWFASVPEAIKGEHADAPPVAPVEIQDQAVTEPDNAPPTRAELEAKATELGIKFDGRTTDKKLVEMIHTAME